MQNVLVVGGVVALLGLGSLVLFSGGDAEANKDVAAAQANLFVNDMYSTGQSAPNGSAQAAAVQASQGPEQNRVTNITNNQQGASRSNGQLRDVILQNHMQATLHTNQGDITIDFMDSDAPNTVANFIKLAKAGFYDGTKFHRVIAGFMIQGGDPFTKDDSMVDRWGTGGPGYKFEDEIHANNRNEPGTIAMANSGPNTNGSQFFINVADNAFLDGKHTVFGKVVSGLEVVQKIEETPTGEADRPLESIIIESVTLK